MNNGLIFGVACLAFAIGVLVGVGMMCMAAISSRGREK